MMPRNRRSRRRTALAAVLCTSIGDVVQASVSKPESPSERTYASVVSGSSSSPRGIVGGASPTEWRAIVGGASPTARQPASTVSTRPAPRISQPTPRTFFEFEIRLQIFKSFDVPKSKSSSTQCSKFKQV